MRVRSKALKHEHRATPDKAEYIITQRKGKERAKDRKKKPTNVKEHGYKVFSLVIIMWVFTGRCHCADIPIPSA